MSRHGDVVVTGRAVRRDAAAMSRHGDVVTGRAVRRGEARRP